MREVEDSQMSPNIYKAGIPKMGTKQMKQKVLYWNFSELIIRIVTNIYWALTYIYCT